MSHWFSSQRGWATPHLNVHYRLSYVSDKFIKNTIWIGLRFVLYFQFSHFLPCPTGISAPISVTLFTKPHCQNPASCVCLLLVLLCHPSVHTYHNSLCYEQKAKGNCLGRNYFSSSVHRAVLLNKLNLLLLNAKVAYEQSAYVLRVYECWDDSDCGDLQKKWSENTFTVLRSYAAPGWPTACQSIEFRTNTFLKGSVTSWGQDLRATCTGYIQR